jgi:predicted methyltransferase
MQRSSRLLLVSGLLQLAVATMAQQQSVKPGINDQFKDSNLKVEEWAGRFETESREVFQHRQKIVEATGVKPDSTVADVGAGTGLFTMLFADAVGPAGKVLAVDIAPPFLAKIRERAKAAGRPNVETVLGTDKDTKLPESAVDLVFICDTYHHFEFPQATLATIHRALKPGGLLVLVDFQRIPGKSSDWVLGHVRAGKETFLKEIMAAGFEMVDEAAFLEENYFVRLRKRDITPTRPAQTSP